MTQYLYDERDLLFKVTDANQGLTTYSYDPNGTLTLIKDANTNTTQYTYDGFDRLKETIYPDTSKETYTYDSASNLVQVQNPNAQVTNYQYDALNRLGLKEYINCQVSVCGGNVSYSYDKGSRLTQVSNNLSQIQYQYDPLNRVKEVTTTLNNNPFTVSYQYDPSGNRTQLQYPHGRIIKYGYDELNRLDTIKNQSDQVLYDFSYDPLSRRTSLSRPNGITTSYTYDSINRLTQIQHGSIATISYPFYDRAGNRKRKTDSQGTHNYTYDSIYQLTNVTGPQASSYNYDPVGNRLTASGTGIPSSYTPNNLNQYSSVDGTIYTYDSNGNLTSDGTNTYSYDYENRLISVIPAQAGIQSVYQYDPLGRRITKTTSTDSISYLYDGDQILESFPCNLTLTSCGLSLSFLSGPGIDEPLELIQHPSLTTYDYHQDGLGSVINLTNSGGSSVESYTYGAYGIPSATSTLGNPFLFTGREWDVETALYHYRTRTYHPKIGRFIQRDPLGFFNNMNLFAYVGNSPVNYTDPSGLLGEDVIKKELDKLLGDKLTEPERQKVAEFTGRQIKPWHLPGLLSGNKEAGKALEERVRQALKKADPPTQQRFKKLEEFRSEIEAKMTGEGNKKSC